ncbi:MAG: MFS transporter [Bacteroidetes bacterium]|nr:MFS transporter [Bacteroidota bacterium]
MNISIPVNSRLNRIAVSVFFFIAGLTSSSWASRIPDVKDKLHLSDAGLGGILFALPVGQLISMPLSGWLISKFGSRQLLIWSSIFFPLTLIMIPLATTSWLLIIILIAFGLWGNLLNISMNTQAVGIESMYGRSIMASFHGLWSIAGFSGALLGSIFVSTDIPPLYHFVVIAILISVLISGFYKFTLPSSNVHEEKPKLFVKPDKSILLLGLIAFFCMICEGSMADWSGVYFKSVVNAPEKFITLGYVCFTGTMAAGRFLGDKMITRFGFTNILKASGCMIAAGLLITITLPYLETAAIGCLLVGAGVSCVVPMVYGLAGRSSNMSPQFALAAVSTIGFLGFLAGPPIIGFIAQLSSLRWSFALIACMGFSTTLLAGSLKKVISLN